MLIARGFTGRANAASWRERLQVYGAAAELRAIGGSEIALDDTLAPQRSMGAALRLSWSVRSRQSFFLRAEDFFAHLRRQARNEARRHRDERESRGIAYPIEALEGSSVHADERDAARYVGGYDARSHDESFMDLFTTSVCPGGLYLLDEPEAPAGRRWLPASRSR